MKKYTNIIILAVLLLGTGIFFAIKYIDINDLLLGIGYYEQKVSIANTADVHGHITFDESTGGYYTFGEVETVMGLPLIKNFVDEFKSKNKNTLFLDCGDMFHGTNEANIENGKAVVDVVNKMGYDAMVPGNHDFNFGVDRLIAIGSQLKFPVLAANIYKDGKLLFEEYKIVEMGGKKIAIFGLSNEDSLLNTNTQDNKGVTVESAIKTAERLVPILRQKADAVFLISHLGEYSDKELIEKVDGIDLVFSAHLHFAYEKPKKVNNTYFLEAGGFTNYVGFANVYFRNNKVSKISWHLKTSSDKSKVDPEVNAVAQKYHSISLESLKEVVGKAEVDMDGIRFHSRSKETNFANLIGDVMREEGGADIALMNGGGIRESILKGDISLYKIGQALPFINSLVVVEMKGDKIYSALERGLREYPNSGNGAGCFLQVSGISYEFDGSKMAGQRLARVLKDGKDLDKDKLYKVATNDYLYNGGDRYTEFMDSKLVLKGALLKDILTAYIKRKGTVAPKLEGRIKILNERYK